MSPVVVMLALRWLSGTSAPAFAVHIVIPALAVGCGVAGGYQFPVSMRLVRAGRASVGVLYGLDLLGAAVGALAISAYMLPIFGFSDGAALLVLVNLGPLAAIASTLARTPTAEHAAAA